MSSTHFGFESVDERDKARRVRGVFDSVAPKYDLMNDLMSLGLHRAWKAYTVLVANVREGQQVLDIAGGTGDLALAFAKKVGLTGQVVHTDINEAMLRSGRDRLLDAGVSLPTVVCDAEKLPFADNHFDLVSVAFGLRNMTHKNLGRMVAGDEQSYRYLAESIRMHPGQDELKAMMKRGGFGHVDYHNLTGGVVALHVGIKC
jgi:demethylmenaquinone methyltransferase/2-methoxy-6-polyprenyl-1,4-benzoquinol methylase